MNVYILIQYLFKQKYIFQTKLSHVSLLISIEIERISIGNDLKKRFGQNVMFIDLSRSDVFIYEFHLKCMQFLFRKRNTKTSSIIEFFSVTYNLYYR